MNGIIHIENVLLEHTGRFGSTCKSDLWYLAVDKINPHIKDSTFYDKEFKEIFISEDEIKEKLNIVDHWSRKKSFIAKAMRELLEAKVEIPNREGGLTMVMWFDRADWIPSEGIYFKFSDELKPFLLDLEGKLYTRLSQKDILHISSEWGRKFIEFISEYPTNDKDDKLTTDGKVYREVALDELRNFFGLAKSEYSENKELIKKLQKTIKEINDTDTEYKIYEYEPIKAGHSVIGYKVYAKIPERIYLINKTIDEDELLQVLVSNGVAKPVAKSLLDNYPRARVEMNYRHAKHEKGDKCNAKFIVWCIKEDDYNKKKAMASCYRKNPISFLSEHEYKQYMVKIATYAKKYGKTVAEVSEWEYINHIKG